MFAGRPSAITLSIDPDGQLREVSLKRWGNQTESGEYNYIPFGVTLDEERTFAGFTIPSRLRAGWWFGTERYAEFFRARIENGVGKGRVTRAVRTRPAFSWSTWGLCFELGRRSSGSIRWREQLRLCALVRHLNDVVELGAIDLPGACDYPSVTALIEVVRLASGS